MSIPQEVFAALIEAGEAVGNGRLVVTIKRAGTQATPYEPASGDVFYTFAGIDEGLSDVYVSGSTATRKAHMVMIDAVNGTPLVGDKVQFGPWVEGDKASSILTVYTEAPAGVAVYHRVELSS